MRVHYLAARQEYIILTSVFDAPDQDYVVLLGILVGGIGLGMSLAVILMRNLKTA